MGAIVLDLRPGLGLGPFTLGKFLSGLAFAGIDLFFRRRRIGIVVRFGLYLLEFRIREIENLKW